MQTPSTLSIWLSEQLRPLLLIAAILALVALAVYISLRTRRARMNTARAGLTEDTFVQSLIVYGFDGEIARTTFRYLQQKQHVSFPIQASDMLDEDLGLDAEDVDNTVRDLFDLTSRLYQPGRRYAPLVTVEDLVRFIQSSPRLSELAA